MVMVVKEGKNGIEISGYVNVVNRYSKPIVDKIRNKKFIEKVCSKVFNRALGKGDFYERLRLDLNHNQGNNYGSFGTVEDGTIRTALEDPVGLYADVYTEDDILIEKGLNGDLVGWSYGMRNFTGNFCEMPVEEAQHLSDMSSVESPTVGVHDVTDMELITISLVDRTNVPTSDTTVHIRGQQDIFFGQPLITEPHIIRRQPQKYIYFDEKYGHLLNAK